MPWSATAKAFWMPAATVIWKSRSIRKPSSWTLPITTSIKAGKYEMTRVLVVDDVDQNRYLLRVLLEGNDYLVDCARDGVEALAVAEAHVPDIVITDILMPVMDGFSLCRQWKRHERLKHVPLMFYTSTYTDSNDELYATSLGADAFVIKPAEPADLLVAIDSLLHRRNGVAVAPRTPASDETVVLKQYNSVLIQKLEQKVDQLEAATQRAQENEERLTLALEAQAAGIWDWDMAAGRLTWSRRHADLFGMPLEQFDGTYASFLACLHPRDIEAFEADVQAGLRDRTPVLVEFRIIWPDGSVHWMSSRGRAYYGRDGTPTRMCGVVFEISELKKSQEQMRLAAQFFAASQEAILITDAAAHIVSVNEAFSNSTGYPEHEVVGLTPAVLKSDRHPAPFFETMWRTLEQTGKWSGELVNRRKNGSTYPARLSISAVASDSGTVSHYVGIITDMSSYRAAEDRIQYMAYFDALTGLPNRTLLSDRATRAIAAAHRDQQGLAILFMDLDQFKTINDSLGHSTGDAVLQAVASRLKLLLREVDTVSRYGGDEFTLLLPETDSKGAAQVAAKVIEVLREPFEVGIHSLVIGISIGISLFPADANDFESLLRNADIALFRAKAAGRNNFQFFTSEMNDHARYRLGLELALRSALANRELALHYQPQFELASGALVGYEALLRWHHPERGLVPPIEFIPIAEMNGMIIPIGEWVLNEACRQARQWQLEGHDPVVIAVNLSAVQMRQANIVQTVRHALHESGLEAKYLELELTESLLFENIETVLTQLFILKEIGVRLSIDDFGTGYSSLSYLKRLPIDKLKIDKSFVANLSDDHDSRAIALAIVSMAHSLRLTVTAEGIEHAAQARILSDMRCNDGQGYFYGRPMPADRIASWVGEMKCPP
ncbi:EAL domain-containing protein [Oxalobacteraceae bacterium CAVE-383]|nr:EAL domain-containing protein [Oxalobacteraceae bacterium CAVE-383]